MDPFNLDEIDETPVTGLFARPRTKVRIADGIETARRARKAKLDLKRDFMQKRCEDNIL